MNETIVTLQKQFSSELEIAKTSAELEAIRVKFLGRKGPLQQLMQELKQVSPEQRPEVGKRINDLKEEITARLAAMQNAFVLQEEEAQLAKEKIDVTLPGKRYFAGRKHIISKTLDEMVDILVDMGFSVQYGPDIDTEYYNFEALNFAPDHPARDMQDTFYINSNVLLRTHTSNIQARVMEKQQPPVRIVAPGIAYRNETITARSHVFFHQIEVLYVDTGVSFADLFATMQEFLEKLFHKEVTIRYRPSYFPFVEPGMEVDIGCLACNGTGCSLCKQTGWLEIAGAGMVHPEVLSNCGIDAEAYNGYAWGMGVERIALLKHGIGDIRLFTENDMRFLNQWHV